jgi:hypothetical protein
MEKNKTVYVLKIEYHSIYCEDKEVALDLFRVITEAKCKKLEQYGYDSRYNYVGKPLNVSVEAQIINLYNCGEEAKVAKENEDKLVQSGIMKDKRKQPKVIKIKK